MEKYKKFIAEYKKDFLLPSNLSPKEKDIFIHLFQLLREKINRENAKIKKEGHSEFH